MPCFLRYDQRVADRRRGLVIAALVAVAIGVVGASGAKAATPPTSPSEANCAQAFDRPGNVDLRLAAGTPAGASRRHLRDHDPELRSLWYLVPRSGGRGPGLTATTSALGTIASISVGATNESGNDGIKVTGTMIWVAPQVPRRRVDRLYRLRASGERATLRR